MLCTFVAENTTDASTTNLLSAGNVEIDASSAPISVTTSELGLDSVLTPSTFHGTTTLV